MMKKTINFISLKIVKEKNVDYKGGSIYNAGDLFKLVKQIVGETDREYFLVFNMNNALEPCSIQICSIGSLTETIIHPREVFKASLLSNASKIFVAHTHPSGHVQPSMEDINVTKRLSEVGNLIGINLLDHIIVGGNSYYSFLENGLLQIKERGNGH